MQERCIVFAALLCFALPAMAQNWLAPQEAGLRYSEQFSNSPAGSCGCFTLQGLAADAYWKSGFRKGGTGLGLAADIGLEHTGNIPGAGYGLTFSTFSAGPRLSLPTGRTHTFAQALFGLAHGAGTDFPASGNTLVHSANSFAFDLGAAAEYPLLHRLSLRFLQADYMRTAFPNNSTNWQNHIRLGAGLTLRLAR
jgi:hypothetical protein